MSIYAYIDSLWRFWYKLRNRSLGVDEPIIDVPSDVA